MSLSLHDIAVAGARHTRVLGTVKHLRQKHRHSADDNLQKKIIQACSGYGSIIYAAHRFCECTVHMYCTVYLQRLTISITVSMILNACCRRLLLNFESNRFLPRAIFKFINVKTAPRKPPITPSITAGMNANILTAISEST